MLLIQRITTDGRRLFRLRSVAPLMLAPLMLLALIDRVNFDATWGDNVEQAWLVFCLLVGAVGLALRCLTVGFVPSGTSGRGTTTPTAATLNVFGMYSVVRNPLYLANGIILLAVAAATASVWFVAVTGFAYWIYIERIIAAEEAYLAEQFGVAYGDWVNKTPCFLPRFSLWRASNLAFSLRTVLRREYPGVMGLVTAFTLLEFVADVVLAGQPFRQWLVADMKWVMLFAAAMVFGATVRTLKKLRLLDVPNR